VVCQSQTMKNILKVVDRSAMILLFSIISEARKNIYQMGSVQFDHLYFVVRLSAK